MSFAALDRSEGAASWQAGAGTTSGGRCIAQGLFAGSHVPRLHRSGLHESCTSHSGSQEGPTQVALAALDGMCSAADLDPEAQGVCVSYRGALQADP